MCIAKRKVATTSVTMAFSTRKTSPRRVVEGAKKYGMICRIKRSLVRRLCFVSYFSIR